VASLRPQVRVPAAQRAGFLVAVPCMVACWALGGLYLSLGPSVVAGVFGVPDHLVGSLVILAMNGMGPIGAVVTSRLAAERGMVTGALSFAAGVAITVVALLTGSLALFFVAAVVSGFGFGAAFSGAVATATRGVAPGDRAGLMSSVFVVGYLAFSIPAIIAGVVSGHVGLRPTAVVYAAVLVLLSLAAVGGLLLRRSTPATAAEAPAENEAVAA
jgi:MFS family permease